MVRSYFNKSAATVACPLDPGHSLEIVDSGYTSAPRNSNASESCLGIDHLYLRISAMLMLVPRLRSQQPDPTFMSLRHLELLRPILGTVGVDQCGD